MLFSNLNTYKILYFWVFISIIVSMSMFLVSKVEASSTLLSLAEKRIQQDKPWLSDTLDVSSYENLTLSFTYDSTALDLTPSQDSFSYGWQLGSEKHILGTVLGLSGSSTEEYGVVSTVLPELANANNLTLFIEVYANSTTTSDKVEIKNISLIGDVKVVEPEPAVDVCVNLDGIQTQIPTGYESDTAGNCKEIIIVEPEPVDLCLNLEGIQAIIPDGYVKNETGQCVLPPPPVIDVCPNLNGVQSEMPTGYKNDNGKCVIISTEPTPKPNLKFCPKGYSKWLDRLSGDNTWRSDDVYESVILVGEENKGYRGFSFGKNIYIPGPTEVGDKYYHRFHRISHVCVR